MSHVVLTQIKKGFEHPLLVKIADISYVNEEESSGYYFVNIVNIQTSVSLRIVETPDEVQCCIFNVLFPDEE